MKCLVTGGAGAIGSNLVGQLVSAGHQVTVVDDLSSGHRTLVPAGVKLIEGSVVDDAVIGAAFAGKPEWVFHLAALFANQNSVEHPERDLNANGLGIVKVLQRSVDAGVQKLLYTSSSCVYGNKTVMHESDADRDLDTPYAITKLLGEHYCQYWSRQFGLDTVIVRLFNTYGPHEFPGRYRNVIPNFFALAMKGEPLPVTGTGDETRDFNFVADVAAGIVAAIGTKTPSGEVYNLASGKDTRIGDLALLINQIAGNKAGILTKPRRSWDHVMTRRGDSSKAKAAFGYESKTALADGLQRTYAWLRTINA